MPCIQSTNAGVTLLSSFLHQDYGPKWWCTVFPHPVILPSVPMPTAQLPIVLMGAALSANWGWAIKLAEVVFPCSPCLQSKNTAVMTVLKTKKTKKILQGKERGTNIVVAHSDLSVVLHHFSEKKRLNHSGNNWQQFKFCSFFLYSIIFKKWNLWSFFFISPSKTVKQLQHKANIIHCCIYLLACSIVLPATVIFS